MKKAFTLIELLVVVLIIGILAAVAVPQYNKAVEKSRAAEAVILGQSIVNAEERYFLANGSHTLNFEELDVILPTAAAASGNTIYFKNFRYYLAGGTHMQIKSLKKAYWFDFMWASGSGQGAKLCITPPGDVFSNELCASITGKNFTVDGNGNNSYAF